MKVLKLSAQGLPQSWISLEQAVIHYAADEVRWEAGGEVAVFHGGHNAVTGQQSVIRVNSIIGTRGVPRINPFNLRPGLTNAKLFIRDRNVCAYCGGHFHENDLTREHIIPFAQNGIDNWMNVVTACRLSLPNGLLVLVVPTVFPADFSCLRRNRRSNRYQFSLLVRRHRRCNACYV
uniref:HNH nuclease domain-containing protein n=1 Tax=Curvibacter symbiont subsp. Hydra magnipapillata TaxID=667019 RepID=C9Y8V0_CURXX|nr:hypothetical protein Csp_A05510 [Curvibacter putative symbiont of Hydra magnipapillata]